MTATYLLLAAGFLLPVGSIVLDGALDNDGQAPLFLRRQQQNAAAEIARLTAPLPERRESVLPEDFYASWPQRQTPSDLPARLGLVVAQDRPGRHRAPEPDALTTTDQFWAIVDQIKLLEEPCAHCATPEEGEPADLAESSFMSAPRSRYAKEPAHVGCPGCACPCTLVEVSA